MISLITKAVKSYYGLAGFVYLLFFCNIAYSYKSDLIRIEYDNETVNNSAVEEVRDILFTELDVCCAEGESEEEARRNAEDKAIRIAFYQIIERIGALSANKSVYLSEDTARNELLESINPSWERQGSSSYCAKFKVKLRQNGLKKILIKNGIPFTLTWGPTILVYPIAMCSAENHDCSENWITNWQKIQAYGAIRYKVVNNDIEYVINKKALMNNDLSVIKKLLQGYDADIFLIVILTEKNNKMHIDITGSKIFSGLRFDYTGDIDQYTLILNTAKAIDSYYKKEFRTKKSA